MSLKFSMFPRTIRAKIVFWFTVIVTGILCVFSILVYLNLRNNLYEDTDNLLELKAEGVIDNIDEYWETQKLLKANGLNFGEIVSRELGEMPIDPKLADISFGIFSLQGARLASSERAVLTLSSHKALTEALAGKSSFENQGGGPGRKTIPGRVLTVPIIEEGNLICILQVFKSLRFIDAALKKLQVTILILIPLALILASATALLLANVIVSPLSRIIAAARHITAENLKSRIKAPNTDDEIRQLADTFNQMLAKLETSFSAQKQIVQDISHELRTPLTILKGEIEVVLKKLRSQDEYKTALSSNLEEIDKISRIVENLLMLARFDSQQMALDVKKIDLAGLLDGILADMRILADAKHLTFKSLLDPDIPVRADEAHLRRAVINILDNAIKYTPPGGTVSVTLEKRPDTAVISISDTGIGIAKKDLVLIFDRFYRADSSRSSTGFGLGLSLAKAIVEAHRGTLDVRSELHRGTTFVLSLPSVV